MTDRKAKAKRPKERHQMCLEKDNFAMCVADVTWSNTDVSLARTTTSTHTTGRDETEGKRE